MESTDCKTCQKMSVINKKGILLYLIILLIHCISIYTNQTGLRMVSKLALMPVLMLYFFSIPKSGSNKSYTGLVLAGLLFSMLGDLFLTQTGQGYFLLGMVSFILTHICNGSNFLRIQSFRFQNPAPAVIALLVFVLVTFFVFRLIQPELGSLQIPILIYMGIIGIMGILSSNLWVNTAIRSIVIRYFIPGAVFFIMSDSLLAMNSFHFHDPARWDIPVMLSYGIAQCFLVIGFGKLKRGF